MFDIWYIIDFGFQFARFMTCYNIGLSCLMGKNKKEKENKRSGCGGLSQKKKKKKKKKWLWRK